MFPPILLSKHRRSPHHGVALVIVLAFVVLMTGLIVAFFSQAMSQRQISNSSANLLRADIFAQDALAAVVGDLRQEIAAGSKASQPAAGVSVYLPSDPATAVPCLARTTGTDTPTNAPNLIKRSAYNVPFYIAPTGKTWYDANYPASSRAANSPTTSVSQNARTFSAARWNKALLLPKKDPAKEDLTPDNNVFTAPDWILVARNGTNPKALDATLTTNGTNPVVGRYAYAIYDEGGLLDMNAAGFPDPSDAPAPQKYFPAYKYSLGFANLKQLPGINALSTSRQDAVVRTLVGWRNYATSGIDSTQANPSLGSPVTGSVNNFPTGYAWSTGNTSNYLNFLRGSGSEFMRSGNSLLVNGQSDHSFTSRQQLIALLLNGVADQSTNGSAERASLQNTLQYLGTFSRDLNQPSYTAAVQTDTTAPVVLDRTLGGNTAAAETGYVAGDGDKKINPSFPSVRVTNTFARLDPILRNSDAPQAVVGEPLVNRRFALNRLAWITYQGPSHDRNQSDADIQSLVSSGIPWSYLQLGTEENIRNYFGLSWDRTNNRWIYDIHRGAAGVSRIIMAVGRPAGVTTADPGRYVQDARRDPNFFELLKAGISVGSLGKATTISKTSVPAALTPAGYDLSEVPANLRYNLDSSVDYHVIQIGANILSEANPTSFPVRIAYDDGNGRGLLEFQGVTDLPYLTYVFNGVLRTEYFAVDPMPGAGSTDSSPYQYRRATAGNLSAAGKAYAIQIPAVWNPYDPNGTNGVRPTKFRIAVDSNDPISLANGSANHQVWCAGVASPRSGYVGGNQGVFAPWTPGNVSSYNATSNPTPRTGTTVSDAVIFDDGNGTLYREPTLIFNPAVGNATRTGTPGNITALDANPLPGESDGSKGPWAPLVLGQFPLAFLYSSNVANGVTFTSNPNPTPVLYTGNGRIGNGGTEESRVYLTYRLQYEYPAGSGKWVTYDTKYGRTTDGYFSFQARVDTNAPVNAQGVPFAPAPTVIAAADGYNPFSWASAIDPRTARFGLIMDTVNAGRSQLGGGVTPSQTMLKGANPAQNAGWIFNVNGTATTAAAGVTYPIRPDYMAGFYFANCDDSNRPTGGKRNANNVLTEPPSTVDVPYPSFQAGWTAPVLNLAGWSYDVYMFAPGSYAQNNPAAPFYPGRSVNTDDPNDNSVQPSYYADADGVVRRATGAYVPVGTKTSADSPVGLPTASIQGYASKPATLLTPMSTTPFTQSQSRPLLLHRPFRTVGELGYVFRDVPWKNLDFFTPESGDAALLDLFCINETSDPSGLVAGKVNLNTRQAPVLSAIISGAYVDDPKVTNATVGSTSSTLSDTIANLLVTRTTNVTYGPLQNISELVGKWKAAVAASPGTIAYGRSAGATWGIDLPLSSGYKDGQSSYVGFSGTNAANTGTTGTLSEAYRSIGDASLQTSMSRVQRFREAPIRALSSVGQTRIWNLMIDVVVQTGRYPQSVASLDKFVVEGEQRCWVHLAIDRLTGEVIDKQVEVVKE